MNMNFKYNYLLKATRAACSHTEMFTEFTETSKARLLGNPVAMSDMLWKFSSVADRGLQG